jgi:hypothetical protein
LAQVWQPDESSLGLRIGDGNVPYTESALAYGRRLAGLLGARLEISAAARPAELPAGPGDAPLPQDQQRWSKYEPCSDADAPSGVMLIIYQPKWPLQQLLLLITAGEPPGDAVKWTTLLARAVNASVNVLAVVPTKPEGLAALLDSRSELGSQLHHLARELAVENVQATLRLREQDPSQESCFDAVVGESYDLMLATRATCERWLCGWRRPFLIMGATSDGSPWQTSDAALVGEPTGGM